MTSGAGADNAEILRDSREEEERTPLVDDLIYVRNFSAFADREVRRLSGNLPEEFSANAYATYLYICRV